MFCSGRGKRCYKEILKGELENSFIENWKQLLSRATCGSQESACLKWHKSDY